VAHFARERGHPLAIVDAVVDVNKRQQQRMVEKIVASLGGDVRGKTLGMLGLSFKPETDDVRDSPALSIAAALLAAGARVQAFDPQAMDAAGKQLPDLVLCGDSYEACQGADALVIVTEWNQFRMLDFERIKGLLSRPVVIDLRNVYDPGPMRAAGFEYVCVGRG
jgi:UDPglucose 6-dehydrogenase